jgi:protein O-GlcNAc transferase
MLPNINAVLSYAVQDFQRGSLDEAKGKLAHILKIHPHNIAALEILGIVYATQGNTQLALKHFDKITEIKPDYDEAWSNRGNALLELKQYEQALASYNKAVSMKSDNAGSWYNRGNALSELKQYDQALASYDKAISIKSDTAAFWYNRGNALSELEQYEQALDSYDKAVSIKSDYAEAWSNRGNALSELKQYKQALDSYDKAINFKPDYAEVWFNYGNTFSELKQYDQALAFYDKAISIKPDYAEAWSNRGNALSELKQNEQALTSYDRAISIKSDYVEAWSNRGNALSELKQYDKALASYDRAISIKSDYVAAWSNRGNVLIDIGQFSLSVASHREAIKLDPESLDARSKLLFSLNYLGKLNPQELVAEAKIFGLKASERANSKFINCNAHAVVERLRIGFVSGDLRKHSVGYFIEGLLEKLDRDQFEIFAFTTTTITDDLTNRIKPFFTEWFSIYEMSDPVAAKLIHETGINVLIDLSGHTAYNRLPVFSYRPAKVQVSWLGLPMTTGIPEMDYVLGDSYALPQEFENQFTEDIWRLPESYLCLTKPDTLVQVEPLPSITNGYITFASFNNLSKMNDRVVEAWSNILKALPNAKLLLKNKQLFDSNIRSKTLKLFGLYGVTPDRLIFKNMLESRDEHFSVYNDVDIALDTFPYPGVTTTIEAYWMGVPVLTMKGNSFLSGTATSIAKNAGLFDWIASDVDEYVSKAVEFSSDLNRLSQLRSTLRERVLKSPLLDSTRFANKFGDALWEMWNKSILRKDKY